MHALGSRASRRIDRGDNVLVLCPSFEADEPAACVDLLTFDEPADKNVLCISFTESVADRRIIWERYAGSDPERAAVIDVTAEPRPIVSSTDANGNGTDTDAETGTDAEADTDTVPHTHADSAGGSFDPTLERVSSPSDLTTLGVRVTDRLDDWLPATGDDQTVVCFESISTLLQYADRQRTYEFLDAITQRIGTADAIAHYHMDPAAHDDETVARLKGLFDAVCECEAGEWRVRAR